MDNSRIILCILMSAVGILSLLASVLNWDWFFKTDSSAFIVKSMGRQKARWIYGIIGVFIIIMSVFICLEALLK